VKRIDGPYGHAIKQDLLPPSERPNPDAVASMDRWILYLPQGSPAWTHYMLSGASLADFPGVPPAAKRFPEATHEVIVAAIDPDFPKEKLERGGVKLLTPLNYAFQVVATDAAFNRLLKHLALGLINGELTPEPQGIQGARELMESRAQQFLKDTGE
jgi:hypothetical protein